MYTLKQTLHDIKGDLPKNGLKYFINTFFFNPSFRLLLAFRIGKYLAHSRLSLLRLVAARKRMKLINKYNCDFSFNATIGRNCKFAHPLSIVIGSTAVIGNDVTIFQNVTLGSHGKKGHSKLYPTIENGVTIYTGAILIGGITVGENSIIGAGTLVNCDIPANSVAYGNPCKIKPITT